MHLNYSFIYTYIYKYALLYACCICSQPQLNRNVLCITVFPSALHINFSQLSPLSFPHRCHLICRMSGTWKFSSLYTCGKNISVVLATNDENFSTCNTNYSFTASFSLYTNSKLKNKSQLLERIQKKSLKCNKEYITLYHKDNIAKLRRYLPLWYCLLQLSHNIPQRLEVLQFLKFLFKIFCDYIPYPAASSQP